MNMLAIKFFYLAPMYTWIVTFLKVIHQSIDRWETCWWTFHSKEVDIPSKLQLVRRSTFGKEEDLTFDIKRDEVTPSNCSMKKKSKVESIDFFCQYCFFHRPVTLLNSFSLDGLFSWSGNSRQGAMEKIFIPVKLVGLPDWLFTFS